MSAQRGQALVETVAIVPILLVCGLLTLQAMVAGANRVAADTAAHAAMVASLTGGDAERAARDAVPGWSRGSVTVRISGRRVGVVLRPRTIVPELASILVVRSTMRLPGGE